MANTYSQVYIHIVFTVQGRQNLILEKYRVDLQKYITGIISNRGQKLLAIYCMPDHVHILIGLKPNIAISDLVRDVKAGSSKFVNDSKWLHSKFSWQNGYGAFSYSHSQIGNVIGYISKQREHHRKSNFREEYIALLKKFDLEYDEEYLFEWID